MTDEVVKLPSDDKSEDIVRNRANDGTSKRYGLSESTARFCKLPEDGVEFSRQNSNTTQSHMSRAHIRADRSMIVGIDGSSMVV